MVAPAVDPGLVRLVGELGAGLWVGPLVGLVVVWWGASRRR